MPEFIESGVQFRTVVSGVGGEANAHVINIAGSSGGDRLGEAVIRIAQPGIDKDYVESEALIDLFADRTCEVYKVVDGGTDELVHYGRISGGSLNIAEETHELFLTSRVDDHWFSDPVDLAPYRDVLDSGEVVVPCDLPWVMNPERDGHMEPNQYDSVSVFQFVHVESFGINFKEFTLVTGVQFLMANLRKTPLLNVDTADLAVLDPYPLRNVRFEKGMFLPQCLERLLKPYGYDFKIYPVVDSVPSLKLKIWKRTAGLGNINVKLAAITSHASSVGDPTESEIDNANLTMDIADNVANIIILMGDPVRIEGTFPLFPAWTAGDESTDPEDISTTGDPGIKRVFRDYVLGEAGNYDHISGDDQFDAAVFFGGDCTHRRRRFYPMLTLGEDRQPLGRSHGYEVEFHNGTDWQQFDEPFKILKNECGIQLTSTSLNPSHMVPGGLQLRITATLESDLRVGYSTGFNNTGPLTIVKKLVIPTQGKYRWWFVQSAGDYASKYSGGPYDTAEVDDRTVIQNAATEMMLRFNKANTKSEITVRNQFFDGPDVLGFRIEQITGRNISLSASPTASDRFPIITGYRMDLQQQLTTYFLDNATGQSGLPPTR